MEAAVLGDVLCWLMFEVPALNFLDRQALPVEGFPLVCRPIPELVESGPTDEVSPVVDE